MTKEDCVIYEGLFFQIEWYFDSKGNSQPFDYFQECDLTQKRKFLMLCQRMGDFGKIMDCTKFRNKGGFKMTTFDKFFDEHPGQKPIYDKEYNDFLLSEFMLEKMEEENISVRELAKKAHVSPTVIQKLRSKDAERVTLTTFTSVLNCLGYKIKLEKLPAIH
ncbi:helix-turn-helix domain-containing protein [Treponema sp. UBA6852]|uniref:helix-turn-helix domain-containing protein n=2 Tax=Treponema TaxID=157 RepID=UPI0025DFA2BA|nr:helix-turn-helix transcriptional regulator [Treponema sp. UBA6852]